MNSLLEPYLEDLLRGRLDTLDLWRRQTPAQSHRVKNFENWLIVECVERLLRSGVIASPAKDLKTNGDFSGKQIKASEIRGLRGSAPKKGNLSVDISLRLKTGGVICAEIKTGLERIPVLNDAMIVRHYQTQKHICDRAEFIWVAMFSDAQGRHSGQRKTFQTTLEMLQRDHADIPVKCTEIAPWLMLVTAVYG